MKRLKLFTLILPFLVGCMEGGTSAPASVNPIHHLDPPKILQVICYDYEGLNYISIEWSNVPGAAAYHVYISEDTAVPLFEDHKLNNSV